MKYENEERMTHSKALVTITRSPGITFLAKMVCFGDPRESYGSLVSQRAHQCLVVLGCPKLLNSVGFLLGKRKTLLQLTQRKKHMKNGLTLQSCLFTDIVGIIFPLTKSLFSEDYL